VRYLSVKRNFIKITVFISLIYSINYANAQDISKMIKQGNNLFTQGKLNDALNQYNQVLTQYPKSDQAKFNLANTYYRLDDLQKARDLYKEVSAQTKDMGLVQKAKYNLGNVCFKEAIKQKDSDLQKSVDGLTQSISYWRKVLDDSKNSNAKAAKNIEVTKLIIKDIMDQIKKQQQKKKQDPNQPPKQKNQKQQSNKNKNKQKKKQDSGKQKQDKNKKQEQSKKQKQKQKQKKQQQQKKQKKVKQNMTAQRILDKEQKQKKDRRKRYQRIQSLKVDKDW